MNKKEILEYIIKTVQIPGGSKPMSEVGTKDGNTYTGFFFSIFIGGKIISNIIWLEGRDPKTQSLNLEEIVYVKDK